MDLISNNPAFISGFMLSLISFATALVARLIARRGRPSIPNDSSLDVKLKSLASLSSLTVSVANEVQVEVAAQVEVARQAMRDADEASHLSALTQEQRDAVASLVRGSMVETMQTETQQAKKLARWVNTAWFAAGVIASIAVTLFVRPLYA